MPSFKKNNGFTLIEMIFVVAIIGVIIVLGMSYTSKLNERSKENMASLQIQQILQAAMTYYIQKDQWPSQGDSGSSNADADFNKNYLPARKALETNPWAIKMPTYGAGYAWSYTDQRNGIFKVQTKTPSKNIAKRVVALLPNAYTDDSSGGSGDDTIVDVEIAVPGMADVNEGYIINAGSFKIKSSGKKDCIFSRSIISATDKTACTSKGMHVQILGMMQSLHIKFASTSTSALEPKVVLLKNSCTLPDSSGDIGVEYKIRGDHPYMNYFFNIYGGSESSAISYVAMCLPGTDSTPSQEECDESSTSDDCTVS